MNGTTSSMRSSTYSRGKAQYVSSKQNSRLSTPSDLQSSHQTEGERMFPNIHNRRMDSKSYSNGVVSSTEERVSVFPREGIFESIAANTTYSKLFTIRNISRNTISIRVVPPVQTDNYQLIFLPPKTGLAPGLEVSFKIVFSTREARNYEDKCVVLAENDTIEIPLRSMIPSPEFIVPYLFDMGVLPLMRSETKFFELKNVGTKEGPFRFIIDDNAPVYVLPMSGIVGAKSSQQIKIQVKSGGNIGEFRFPIKMEFSGDSVRHIDVIMKVIESKIELVSASGEIGTLSVAKFQPLYFGQEASLKAFLVNPSPFSSSFSFSKVRNDDNDAEDVSADHFSVLPVEGQLPPQSRTPIRLIFHPKYQAKDVGFKSATSDDKEDCYSEMIVEIVETEQKLNFGLSGVALNLRVDISEKEIRFGNCAVHSYQDVSIRIRNYQPNPISFTIDRVAHFSAHPATGVIAACSSTDIVVTFAPNQMGSFKNRLTFSFGGLTKLFLNLFGSSDSISTKTKILGGINKIPEDFGREINYVKTKRTSETGDIEKTLEAEVGGKKREKRCKYIGQDTETEIFLSKLDLYNQKKKNEGQYNSFIRTMREDRVEKQRFEQETNKIGNLLNDVDLGMEPGSGMISPRLIPLTNEDLLFVTDKAESQDVTSLIRKPPKFDENKLIRKKHKSVPSTQNEIRDCKIKLNNQQLSRIVFGPKLIDFGQMTVFASETKSFGITNQLNQYILVQVLTQTGEIKVYPPSQVIPPLATAGFDVIFCSETIQVVQTTMYLSINEHSKIKFVAMGDVIPTDVDISTDDVKFRFNEFSLESSMTETITMKNKGNSTAQFSFHKLNNSEVKLLNFTPYSDNPTHVLQPSIPVFQILPVQAEIPPGGTFAVQITYTPGDIHSCEDIYWLDIRGSQRRQRIRFSGIMGKTKVVCSEKKVEFGAIPVGQRKTKIVSLKNVSENAAVFNIDTVADIKITPMRGRVTAGSTQKLLLEICPSSAQNINLNLLINVRGGRSLKVPIIGEAKIPMVEMDGGLLNFGDVFVGSSAKSQITFKNVGGSIPAVLFLDFSHYSDFHIANEKGIAVTESTDRDEPITIDSPESSDTGDECRSEDGLDSLSDGDGDRKESRRYKLTVEPNSSLLFYIIFKPRSVNSYKFTLALSLAGVPPSMMGFNREVRARAIKPRLITSHHVVDFGKRVVILEQSRVLPHRSIVTFTNEDSVQLEWRKGNFDDPNFWMEPVSGFLNPGQTIQALIYFTPREKRTYSCILPIFLDKEIEKSYVEIQLMGIGADPALTFDIPELVLPVVPLNIPIVQVFTIINDGYERLDVKHRLPIDTSKIPIKLLFPEGTQLTATKTQIPVELTFCSSKPISFTSKIDFFDNDGNKYSLRVSCMSDNCLLTNYPYLANNRDVYRLEAQKNKPVTLVLKERSEITREDDALSSRLSVYSGNTTTTSLSVHTTSDAPLRQLYSKKNIDRLLNWLNVSILSNPVDDLMKTIIFSSGGIVYDIIEYLSGKRPPSRPTKVSANKLEAIRTLYIHYEELLNFLKAYGALLNSVRPEFLLSYEEFQKLTTDPGFPNSYHSHKRMTEKKFRYRSVEAWLTVLYQIIKVFELSRINLRQAKGLSEEIFSGPEVAFSGSNVYGTAENIILKWMTFHLNKQFPTDEEVRVTNFGQDLRDGKVFASLVLNHIPYVSHKLESFISKPNQPSDFEHNASLIVSALNEARLDYVVSTNDILSANPRESLLFCVYLYQTLPQYIPKTTVEFTGNLQEKITKHIEMTNPTKNLIEYNVFLEGSKAFILLEDKLTLKPKAKHNFQIDVTPKFSTPIEARLTFQAKRSGAFNPATMVFNLRTNVIAERFQKLIEVSNIVYENRKIELEVENPFDKNCQFTVTLKQSIKKGDQPTSTVPEAFWCTTDFLPLKRGEKKKIMLQYLPFITRCTYECIILFSDQNVGEFMYCIKAQSKLPEPIQHLEVRTESNQTQEVIIQPTMTNYSVDKAIVYLKERYKNYRIGRSIVPIPDQEQVNFRVEYSSPFYSGPNSITLNKKAPLPELKILFSPKVTGIYPCDVILFNDFDIRLYTISGKGISPGIKSEIEFSVPVRQRVIQEIPINNRTSNFWTIQAALCGDYFLGPSELRIPPNSCIAYPLSYNPRKTGKNQGSLSLSNSDTLEKFVYALRGKADDPLVEGKIQISCNAREQVFYYVDPPNISDNRGSIVYKCSIDIPFITGNPTHPVGPLRKERSISPSLANHNINETNTKERMYKLCVCPPLGGSYSGRLTFTAPDGEYIWYSIEVTSHRSAPESKHVMKSIIREFTTLSIPIRNTHSFPIDYIVNYSGKFLDGNKLLTIQPNETVEYLLTFSPLQVGTSCGSISFYNPDIGEFWYELDLIAEESPPVIIPSFSCPIGRSASYEVEIKNPATEPMKMLVDIENPNNFAVFPSAIVLPPSDSLKLQVLYYPSSIDIVEKGAIRIYNPLIGDWIFSCSGSGQQPSDMEVKKVVGQVLRTQSSILSFRNPFPIPKKISISLVMDDSTIQVVTSARSTNTSTQKHKVFKLMIKHKNGTLLNPFSTIQIPFTFTPLIMREYQAYIIVGIVGEEISWKYPLLGVAEAVTTETFSFKCQARTIVEKVIQISVPSVLENEDLISHPFSGTPSLSTRSVTRVTQEENHFSPSSNPRGKPNLKVHYEDATEDSFKYEVIVPENQDHIKAIKRAITVTEVRMGSHNSNRMNSIGDDKMSLTDKKHIFLKVEFAPLRPLIGTANLIILKQGGGMFKYELLLEATTPEIDDTIEIQSIIGSTEKVGFRLTNIFSEPAAFEAYFTLASPSVFSVQPGKGMLTPYGADGTQFIVNFAANYYGKVPLGILVIDTEEMQWRYEVRGVLPKYIAPKVKKSRIENKLKVSTVSVLKQRDGMQRPNFVKRNLASYK